MQPYREEKVRSDLRLFEDVRSVRDRSESFKIVRICCVGSWFISNKRNLHLFSPDTRKWKAYALSSSSYESRPKRAVWSGANSDQTMPWSHLRSRLISYETASPTLVSSGLRIIQNLYLDQNTSYARQKNRKRYRKRYWTQRDSNPCSFELAFGLLSSILHRSDRCKRDNNTWS